MVQAAQRRLRGRATALLLEHRGVEPRHRFGVDPQLGVKGRGGEVLNGL